MSLESIIRTSQSRIQHIALPLNTMKYFLELLDNLDAQERHEIMYGAFMVVIESVETAPGLQ